MAIAEAVQSGSYNKPYNKPTSLFGRIQENAQRRNPFGKPYLGKPYQLHENLLCVIPLDHTSIYAIVKLARN